MPILYDVIHRNTPVAVFVRRREQLALGGVMLAALPETVDPKRVFWCYARHCAVASDSAVHRARRSHLAAEREVVIDEVTKVGAERRLAVGGQLHQHGWRSALEALGNVVERVCLPLLQGGAACDGIGRLDFYREWVEAGLGAPNARLADAILGRVQPSLGADETEPVAIDWAAIGDSSHDQPIKIW